jgi:hypothetical protein
VCVAGVYQFLVRLPDGIAAASGGSVSAASASRVGRHGVEFLSFCFFCLLLQMTCKRLACRLGTVILHLLTMHISCIAHVRWFGQFRPCVKDDVISSIALAVIPAHPPVPRSPHELSVLPFTSPDMMTHAMLFYISSMIWKWPTADPNTRYNLNPNDARDVVRNPNTAITSRPRRWSENDIVLTLTQDIT